MAHLLDVDVGDVVGQLDRAVHRVGIDAVLEGGGVQRAMIDEPDDAMGPGDRLALRFRPGGRAGRSSTGRYMSCWMSSSRLQMTFTGPSTCLAIRTACAT